MNRLAICLALLPFSISAQITIDNSDMPIPNQTFELSTGDITSNFDWSETGANFTWDFADLESTGTTGRVYQETGDSPFVYQIIFSNPWDPEHQASYGLVADFPDLDFGISVSDPYIYLQNNEEFYSTVGMGISLNDFPVPALSEPIDRIYEFPVNYENEHVSYSEILFDVPQTATWKMKQTRNTTVDGWGSVTTPEGTFECLRVKHEMMVIDSMYLAAFGLDFELERPAQTIYQWMAKDQGIPVLEVTTTLDQTSQILFRTGSNSIVEHSQELRNAFPNPTDGLVTFPHCQGGVLKVFDETGKLVESSASAGRAVNLESHPAGIYTWTLEGDCNESGSFILK